LSIEVKVCLSSKVKFKTIKDFADAYNKVTKPNINNSGGGSSGGNSNSSNNSGSQQSNFKTVEDFANAYNTVTNPAPVTTSTPPVDSNGALVGVGGMSANDFISALGGLGILNDNSAEGITSVQNAYATNTPMVTTPTIPTYTGPSIIDYLDSAGLPSDTASRAKLAKSLGLAYDTTATGQISAAQNTALLNALRSGKTSTVTDAGAPITSNDVITNKNLETGIVNGILPEKPEQPKLTKAQKWYMETQGWTEDMVRDQANIKEIGAGYFKYQETERANQEAEDAAQSAKDALLNKQQMEQAQADTEYAKLIDDVKTQTQGAVEQAQAALYASNPYAATQLGGDNAQQVIQTHNQKTIAYATTLYDQSKSLRAAGYEMAANDVDAKLNEFLASSRDSLSATLNDLAKTSQQASQFNISQKNVAQDNLMNMVNTFGGSPELQTDLQNYIDTGTQSDALVPFFNLGRSAGLADSETASIIQYGTDKARKDAQTLALSEAKYYASLDKQDYQSRYSNTQASVLAMANNLSSQGIKTGTLDFALPVATATAGSPLKLTSADIAVYTDLMSFAGNLSDVKDTVQDIAGDDSLIKIALSNAGRSVQSVTNADRAILNSKMNALASRVGRSIFGEGGRLSDKDIDRFLGILPSGATTADVRNAMYNFMATEIATRGALQLQNDALAFKPVAGYVQPIKQLVEEASELVIDKKNSITYNGKTYNFPTLDAMNNFKKDLNIK
jgi:hypothetical protein